MDLYVSELSNLMPLTQEQRILNSCDGRISVVSNFLLCSQGFIFSESAKKIYWKFFCTVMPMRHLDVQAVQAQMEVFSMGESAKICIQKNMTDLVVILKPVS